MKAFFLAFMLAVVPAGFGAFVRGDRAAVLHDPVALANWLIGFMFVIDVSFATVGYILALPPARFAHPQRQSVRRGVDGGADLLSAVRPDGRRRAARLSIGTGEEAGRSGSQGIRCCSRGRARRWSC